MFIVRIGPFVVLALLLRCTGLAQAINDDRTQAITLSGTPATFAGDLADATLNEYELSAGLWWRWQAPRTGTATLSFLEGQFGYLSAPVFRVNADDSLTLLNPGRIGEKPGPLPISFSGNRRATTFSAEADVSYLILVQSKYVSPTFAFSGLLDLSSAQVEVSGTTSPFRVRLANFDPAVESVTAGVKYKLGWWIESEAAVPQFETEIPGPGGTFSVRAFLTNSSGEFRVIDSPTISVPRVNDEPSGAIVLDPGSPRIDDNGTDATYSDADTSQMRVSFVGEYDHLDRGGGSLWYRWTSPVNGTVVTSGIGPFRQQLFVDRRQLYVLNSPPVAWNVVAGQEYLFAIVGPSRMGIVGDFGMGFTFQFGLRDREWVELTTPEPGSRYRTGEDIELTARLISRPDNFSGVVFQVDGMPINGDTDREEPYLQLWRPGKPGIYGLSGWVAAGHQSFVGLTTNRYVTVVPHNDAFADRELLTGERWHASGSTHFASLEPGELSLTGAQDARSIWWEWRAPTKGDYQISVSTPGSGTGVVGVYTGGDIGTLQLAAASSPFRSTPNLWEGNSVTFSAEADQEFSVVHEETGFDPQWGMHIDLRPLPSNDKLVHATRLTGNRIQVQGQGEGATSEPLEPAHSGSPAQNSVWYRWRAPSTGLLTLNLSYGLRMAVYTGIDFGSLIGIGGAGGGEILPEFTCRVYGGADYLIALDRAVAMLGRFTLALSFTSASSTAPLHLEVVPRRDGLMRFLVFGADDQEVTISESRDLVIWKDLGSSHADVDGIGRFS